MIKRLIYIPLLFILSCTKGELLVTNNSDTGKTIIAWDPTNDSNLQVTYDLSVNLVRLNPPVWQGTSDPNNHSGYGFNQAGWVNLQYNSTNIWGKEYFDVAILAGTDITVSATPADGYEFIEWSNGITANPITFKLNSDTNITAIVKAIQRD
jgi:hypothetical protein